MLPGQKQKQKLLGGLWGLLWVLQQEGCFGIVKVGACCYLE